MPRYRPPRPHAQPEWVESLSALVLAAAEARSELERRGWVPALEAAVVDALQQQDEASLNGLLEHLLQQSPTAYDILIGMLEWVAAAMPAAGGGQVALLMLPVLSWSRFALPSGEVAPDTLQALEQALRQHVLAVTGAVRWLPQWLSPDQLPAHFGETRAWLSQWQGSTSPDLSLPARMQQESQSFLSDIRCLLAVVHLPEGQPLYRWQPGSKEPATRDAALSAWQREASHIVRPLFSGCGYEVLAPDVLYSAWKQADWAARPFSLRAAIQFMSMTLDLPAAELTATVIGCHEQELVEYRIGLLRPDDEQVCYGMAWSLMGEAPEDSSALDDIRAILREQGVHDVRVLDGAFPLEQCEDCGTALYANREGELQHPEMPEGSELQTSHLH
ncbi:DUF2863 family protein [Leeia aquatica]|uniref:DUF2863 family protein n=1 Tax=Leeia aquatica TaxID=2725557 RepID=A0A847SDJ4_9NEIS|nr:DUF2863 family protein [Leeia aquatica]NLR75379.1 DUF2863 family protein [Leeia aquatica]